MAKPHRPNSIPPELDILELDDTLPSELDVTDIDSIDAESHSSTKGNPTIIDLRDNWHSDDINGEPLVTVADVPSITDEAKPLTYINLTRSPVTLDGVTHEPRPVRFQPVWDLLGQHSTLMGYSAEADSLPYIDDNTIAILPRGVSSLGLLEYIERAIVIDQTRGPLDARVDLEKMRYSFPTEPINVPAGLPYIRFIGGSFDIELEDGPTLSPVEHSARVITDGHVYLPLGPKSPAVLIVPNDGRIVEACQGAYPACYIAVLDEPVQGQRTRLFLIRGPNVAENRSGEGLTLPRAEHKAQPTAGTYELQQRCDALEMQISLLHQREGEMNAFILGLSSTVGKLEQHMSQFLDLDRPVSIGPDHILSTREDVKQHSNRLHSAENSLESLRDANRHIMEEMTRLEERFDRRQQAPTASAPSLDGIADSIFAEGEKLIAKMEPLVDALRKKGQEAGRQWMRNNAGGECWLFHINGDDMVMVDINGTLHTGIIQEGWTLIDGPTPATLPAANGPEGD